MFAEQIKSLKITNLAGNTSDIVAGSATYVDLISSTAGGNASIAKRNMKIVYGIQVTSIGSSGVWTLSLKECDTTAGTYTAVTTAGGAGDDYPAPSTNGVGEFHVKVTKRYLACGIAVTTSGVLTGTPTANIIVIGQYMLRESQG